MTPYLYPGIATPHDYINKAAEIYGVTVDEMKSKTRMQPVTEARQAAFFMIRKAFPNLSLTKIGFMLYRDHATVIHGINKIEGYRQTGQLLKEW